MPTTAYQESYKLILRHDAKNKERSMRQGDRVFVKDPNVKGGGYWRRLPGRSSAEPTQSKNGYLKSAALLFGGAIAGGAVGVLATKWADEGKVKKAVATAREVADQQAQQEVAKIKQELDAANTAVKITSGKYEKSLKTIAEKEREINTLQGKHQKEKDALSQTHDQNIKKLTDDHAKAVEELKSAASKKESEATGEINKLSGEITKLNESHKQEVDRLQSEHQSALGTLQAEHDKLQGEYGKLQSEHTTQTQERQKLSQELKSKTTQIAGLKKKHESAINQLQNDHASAVAQLQQEIGRKEGEAKAAAEASAKALSDKEAAHASAISKLEESHQKVLKQKDATHKRELDALQTKFNNEKEEAIVKGTEQRKQELEQEYWNKAEENEKSSNRELARRTALAEADANTKAMERLTKERQQIMNDARLQILNATDPKARRPGQLIDDDKLGIALGASIRQGYKPDKDTVNVARNFNDATKRLAGRKYAEALQALEVEFKSHAESIYKGEPLGSSANLKVPQIKAKWQKMETAFINQGNREKALANGIEDIRKAAVRKYQAAWSELSAKASGRGKYSEDLVDVFDQRSVKIHKEMMDSIATLIDDIKKQHPLNEPFMGSKPRGDSELKIYAVMGG